MTIHERIFIANDQPVVVEGVKNVIKAYGKEAKHEVIGEAASVKEVEKAFKDGIKPTVALVDVRFPHPEDGLTAAKIIRRESPTTTIIVFSNNPEDWGEFQDAQWNKHMRGRELVEHLTNLQH